MAPTEQISSALAAEHSRPGNSVLMVGNFLSGSQRNRGVCEDLAERLAGAGWNVITTSSQVGRFARITEMLHTAWRRRNEYRVAQVDVYSGPSLVWSAAVCGLLRCLGKPYVLTLHGGNLPVFSKDWRRVTRSMLQGAAAVTAPSGYLLERMRHFRPDLRLLPNAIDLSQYPFRLRHVVRPKLIWVRAFHQIYNPAQAVQVLARLAGEFPDVELIMVGPDKADGSLEASRALAASLGVGSRIQYPGRVSKSEIGQWINRGDIFLNTSTVDNNPVTLLEAMACGACIVSTDAGGIPFAAEHGVDALLVRPGDADAMANSIAMLLRQPDLATALSRNARTRVEALDWSAVLPAWQALLSEVA